MAQPTPPAASSQASHPPQSEDAIFTAFDAYPWTKDPAFMSGLDAILGGPATSSSSPPQQQAASPSDMATHARIFYYSQRIGVTIDFARYKSWLATHPAHHPPDVLSARNTNNSTTQQQQQQQQHNESSSSPLAWQQAAPKAELYVDKRSAAAANGGSSSQSGSEAPGSEPSYPMAFAEMLKLIQEGKPVPGIRQIPHTIIRDPSVKPVGNMAAPRKPWEKAVSPTIQDQRPAETLDAEFPPVEAESAAT